MDKTDIYQFESKLKILLDILSKKKESLIGILNITENQETVLQAIETEESVAFLKEMNKEKSFLIEQVLKSDEVFQGIFDSLEAFEENAPKFKELVAAVQQSIKEVIDLDVKIRVQESRNNKANPSRKPILQVPKVSKQYILSQYAKNKTIDNPTAVITKNDKRR